MVHNYKNTTGPFFGKVIKVGTVAMQLIIFLSFGFINIQQSIQIRPDPAIFQKWLHSYEEDTQGIKIYRPSSFDYPIGWGRHGMKFKDDGTYILYDIAPNDEMVQICGNWKSLSKDQLEITFPAGEKETFILEIKELKPQVLKITSANKP